MGFLYSIQATDLTCILSKEKGTSTQPLTYPSTHTHALLVSADPLEGLPRPAANGVWLIMHTEVGKSSNKPSSQFELEAVTVCSLCAAN